MHLDSSLRVNAVAGTLECAVDGTTLELGDGGETAVRDDLDVLRLAELDYRRTGLEEVRVVLNLAKEKS